MTEFANAVAWDVFNITEAPTVLTPENKASVSSLRADKLRPTTKEPLSLPSADVETPDAPSVKL